MKDLKVVFMGTPIFSVPVLEMLNLNTNVILVVTQPDAPFGRKQELKMCAVKEYAIENNLEVFQPLKIKEDYKYILDKNPDIIITCAYGQIVPKELLITPKYKAINVHASLLPKLRGGSPIHKAIIDGYSSTGITIMYMDTKMDNGDIISQSEIDIDKTDNVSTLHDKLSVLGTKLLKETLPNIISGNINQKKQDEKEVTYAYNIKREDEHIDFNKTAKEVFNQIRGLYPHPGSFAILDDEVIKISECVIGEKTSKIPGEIVSIYKNGIGVMCSDKEVIITKLKPSGKKEMEAVNYINGKKKENLLGKILC